MANPKIEISNCFKATRPKHMYGRNPRFWVRNYEVAASKWHTCLGVAGMTIAAMSAGALVGMALCAIGVI